MERQREHLMARTLSACAVPRIHAGYRRLMWDGNGIVDERLDAAGGEMRLKLRPVTDADNEQRVHMPGTVLAGHVGPRPAGKLRPIAGGERPASRRPAGKARQPRTKDGGLHFVETGI